jgi:tetratricopeptide (TPR) repeat protein
MSVTREPPPEILGFGNCLLWLLATSATEVIDSLYRDGPARPTEEYRMLDGHDLPTQSAVAWLLLAAEHGVSPASLTHHDKVLSKEQTNWRGAISHGMSDHPRRFKERWVDDLAEKCGLTDAEAGLLKQRRLGPGYPIMVDTLRKAVNRTRSERASSIPENGHAASADQAPSKAGTLITPPAGLPGARGHRPLPRMLPRGIDTFTGREPELRLLVDAARRTAEAPGVVGVYVVEAMGGVGKTALALRAAHRIAHRFADGRLFLDLQGYTPGIRPVTPEEALSSLLDVLGWPGDRIPPKLPERVALYRSLLDGTRTLIVLDNAASLAQVEPLLPGAAGCLVIVTCRHALGLDGARLVPLGTPPEAEAADLFRAAAGPGRIAPGDPNVAEIVARCECLPLALAILAARLARRQSLSTAEMLAELRHEHHRLGRLADVDRNVAAVLELSYRHLPDNGQQMFGRLGLIPGPDFGIDAVTSLFRDADDATILSGLDSLLDHNLLIPRPHGRYRFHDLVRAFARLKSAALGQDGLDDLLDFYLHSAQAADSHLDQRIPPVAPRLSVPVPRAVPELATVTQAREWLTAELPNLEAALREAVARGRDAYAIALSEAIAEHLRANGPWETAMSMHRLALESSTRAGNPAGQAVALLHIGVNERQAGRLADARSTLSRAVAKCRPEMEAGAAGSRPALAGALIELGLTLRLTAELDRAECAVTEAHDIYVADDSLLGQAAALRELGAIQRQASQFAPAEQSLIRAGDLYGQVGNRYGQASTLTYLAGVQVAVRAYEPACEALLDALSLFEDMGDQIGQANSLLYLGKAHSDHGALAAAENALARAREIYERLGDSRNVANALAFLGDVQRLSGRHQQADQSLTEALRLFRDVHDPGGEAEAMNLYAALALASNALIEARHRYARSLRLARAIKSPRDQADALEGIANCRLAEGIAASARRQYEKALALYVSMGSHADEARLRATLGEIAVA